MLASDALRADGTDEDLTEALKHFRSVLRSGPDLARSVSISYTSYTRL